MEMNSPFTPKALGRPKLTRSQSAQPEEWALTSSPYSSGRKPKSPGRSLTAIFTRTERSERASSEDLFYRRRTIGTHYSDVRNFEPVQEQEEMPMDISNPDMYNHNFSLQIHSDLDRVNDSYININQHNYHNAYQERNGFDTVNPSSRIDTCVRKRNVMMSGDISDVSEAESVEESSKVCLLLKKIFKLFFWCTVLLVVILLALFSFSSLFVYQKKQCEEKQSMRIPLDILRSQVTSQVIGQEIATGVLLKSLQDMENEDSQEPLVMWMVGWSGSGKTHTINILKNLFPAPKEVLNLIPSILMVSSSTLQKDVSRMLKKLDSCSPKLILIDGWDEDDNISINVLRTLFAEFRKHSQDDSAGRFIVIVSGTEGSREINREYLKYRLMGKDRESLQLSHFANVTQKIVKTRKLDALTSKVVVVPFMPLEKPQVEECILQELDTMQYKKDEIQNLEAYANLSVVQEVLQQIQFIPPGQPLLSVTGCKRIKPLLRLLISDV